MFTDPRTTLATLARRSGDMSKDLETAWWHLLMTDTGRELEVERDLQRRGHDAYAPAETVWANGRRGEKIQRALFPSYVFVLVDPTRSDTIVEPRRAGDSFAFRTVEIRHAFSSIEARPGVGGFVRVGQQLGRIAAGAVEELRAAQTMCLFDRTLGRRARSSAFSRGQSVRFTGGPWAGLVGIVQRTDGHKERVRLLLQLFGRSASVEVGEAELVPA